MDRVEHCTKKPWVEDMILHLILSFTDVYVPSTPTATPITIIHPIIPTSTQHFRYSLNIFK